MDYEYVLDEDGINVTLTAVMKRYGKPLSEIYKSTDAATRPAL
jgi:hypothetical protein